jgi:hypothetical protein
MRRYPFLPVSYLVLLSTLIVMALLATNANAATPPAHSNSRLVRTPAVTPTVALSTTPTIASTSTPTPPPAASTLTPTSTPTQVSTNTPAPANTPIASTPTPTPTVTPSRSASYFVDSEAGSDSNTGTSPSAPWKSLSKVSAASLAPGDSVNFKRGGFWQGTLTIKSSGSASSPITIQAYGTGPNPTISYPNVQHGHAINIDGSYVVVQDFTARDAVEAGIAVNSGAHNVVVQNNEMTKDGEGVQVKGANALITHNYIHDMSMVLNTPGGDDDYGATGVILSGSSNTEVSYNRFVNCVAPSYDYGTDGGAIEFWSDVSGANVHHNYSTNANGFFEIGGGSVKDVTIAYNVSDRDNMDFAVLHLSGTFKSTISNFKVDNNTMVRSDGWYRLLVFDGETPPPSFYFRNNVVYSNTGVANADGFTHDNNIYYLYGEAGLGNISLGSGESQTDPKFENLSGGDYHLTSDSPAIGAGLNLGYTSDFDGNPIPEGKAPDAGAY